MLLDADQFVICSQDATREEMFFYVEIEDGEKVLPPYFKNLSSIAQFKDFACSEPQLSQIVPISAAKSLNQIAVMRK